MKIVQKLKGRKTCVEYSDLIIDYKIIFMTFYGQSNSDIELSTRISTTSSDSWKWANPILMYPYFIYIILNSYHFMIAVMFTEQETVSQVNEMN